MSISKLSPKIVHDAAVERCRSPIGPVPCGAELTLAFLDSSGAVSSADLICYSDNYEQTYPMTFDGERWYCRFNTGEAPMAAFYLFRLTCQDAVLWLCAGARPHFGQLASSRREGFRLTIYKSDFESPSWFMHSVMYQIFPDRFSRDESDTAARGIAAHKNAGRPIKYHESWDEAVDWKPNSADGFYFPLDFFGGTLCGIEEKLPYLHELGIGVLYLNPIFEAASNHRYDTGDYSKVDPVLGNREDLIRLCERAETLGMRIMLDGVFSHTGADSLYFNKFSRYDSKGAYNSGKASPFYKWYSFGKTREDYRSWWNFKSLPEVNEFEPSWQEHVISGDESVVRSWLRDGVSGWRLDVADELPDEVLTLIRKAAKEESSENVILGEVWEDAVLKTSYDKRRNYALGFSLDSVMNYPFRQAALDFFCFRSDAHVLASFLLMQRLCYPPPLYYSLMNLLGSHDTERLRTALATRLDSRSLSREQQADFIVSDSQDAAGAAMQRPAAALQFSLPGVPSVYYGDEVGMSGMCDPFCRAPFRSGKRSLLDWYKTLGKLRREFDCLRTGALSVFAPSPDVLCILRFVSGGRDVFGQPAADGAILCVINRSSSKKHVVADIYRENSGLSKAELSRLTDFAPHVATNVVSGATLNFADGLLELKLPAESAEFFLLHG